MKIWILTFESKDTVKVGGLAEVPPRIGEELSRRGFDVEVIVPSHGFKPGLNGLNEILETSINGEWLKIYEYRAPSVKHIIISSTHLDDPEVYSPRVLSYKVRDYARGLRIYAEYMHGKGVVPSIIHGNDWHSVPSLITLNNFYTERGLGIIYIYHIHLLSRVKFDLEELTSGIMLSENSLLNGVYGLKTLREYYELSRGYADRLGSLISNKTITVSSQYVKDVVKRVGFDLLNHVDYVPNAITWSIEELVRSVSSKHPSIAEYLENHKFIKDYRRLIREYFLVKALNSLLDNEPLIDNVELRELIQGVKHYPFKEGGKPYGFKSDGPMVLMTGRLSGQKGVDVLLKAVEDIVLEIPEIRIILMLLPVWGELRLLEKVIEYALTYYDNMRVILGKALSIYELAYLSSNLLIAPSLYEPFGLISLEAMITGNPVVASKTGGLSETVLDILKHGLNGTGLHVEPGDSRDLAFKTINLTLFMETQYLEPWSSKWFDTVERINDRSLRNLLLSNPNAPFIIRRRCISRALEYSWSRSVDKLLEVYGLKTSGYGV